MPYYDSTITAGVGLNTGADIVTFINAGLAAHSGWVLVEQLGWTFGSTNDSIAYIWKCLGSQNAGGQDFHVVVSYRQPFGGSSYLPFVAVCEGYNPTTHKVIRPAPWISAAINQTDFSIGNGTEITMQGFWGYSAMYNQQITQVSSIYVDNFLVISKSFIAYSCNLNGAAKTGFYAGNFNPVYSSTYNPVIIVSTLADSNNNQSSATRWPNYTMQVVNDANIIPATMPNGYVTNLGVPETIRGVTEACGVLIVGAMAVGDVSGGSIPTITQTAGGLRGSLPTSAMLYVNEATNTLRNGDTFSVGGVTYFRVGQAATGNAYQTSSSTAVLNNKSFWISKSATY